jgi:hypothetical protein
LTLGRAITTQAVAFDCYYDDAFISDTAHPTDNGGVYQLLPNAVGTYSLWVSGTGSTFAEVDDDGAHDTDTTYIKALLSQSNANHSFNLQSLEDVGANGGYPTVVKVGMMNRTESISGTSALYIFLLSYGDAAVTTPVEWTATYTYYGKVVDLDPDGGGLPWSRAAVNDLEIGVQANTIAQAQRCTQMSAMVWMTPPPPPPPTIVLNALHHSFSR